MKRLTSALEPLEARIAPATLVSPTTVTYRDLDGDDVTVKFSKPVLTDLNVANGVLHFGSGNIVSGAGGNAAGQGLQLLDFTSLATAAATSLGVTLTAKRSATNGGDGFADLGYLNATGLDLGAVSIGGDLGRLVAGHAESGTAAATDTVPAVKSLTVQSMGELGTSTQAADGTLASTFAGPLPSLIIKGHLRDATLTVTSPAAFAKIGTASIGGSVLGGKIITGGEITSIKIAGDVRGGAADNTGVLSANAFGSITIGGSLIGTTAASGVVQASTIIKSITVSNDLRGGLMNSGRIAANREILSLTVGGTLFGGSGLSSGAIETDHLGKTVIGGDLLGSTGAGSASITAGDLIDSITVKGSMFGGVGADSARISADEGIGAVTIGGSLRGGLGFGSASIVGDDDSGAWSIGGSVVGYQGAVDEGEESALLQASSFTSIKIGGSLIGGSGESSGKVNADFDGIGPVTIGGSLIGGAGRDSGQVHSEDQIGAMTVGGDLRGGAGTDSGQIFTNDVLASLTINGSVLSGAGTRSGQINGYTGIPTLTIKGSLIGTAAVKAAILSTYNATATGPDSAGSPSAAASSMRRSPRATPAPPSPSMLMRRSAVSRSVATGSPAAFPPA